MTFLSFFLFRVNVAQEIVKKFLTRPATSDSGVDTCEETQETEKFIDALKDETIAEVVSGTYYLIDQRVSPINSNLSFRYKMLILVSAISFAGVSKR